MNTLRRRMADSPKRTARMTSILGAIALGAALLGVALWALLAPAVPRARAEGPDGDPVHAQAAMTGYVVVRFTDAQAIGRRIQFTGPISGYRALELAGLHPLLSPGGQLCRIDGSGSDVSGDWCDAAATRYWASYHLDNAAWTFNSYGVTDPTITQAGHVEGFSWSDPVWTAVPPPPAAPLIAAVNGLEWLRPLQSPDDGGYGAGGATAETLFAVAAGGYRAAEWRPAPGERSLAAYFLAHGAALAGSGAAASGKLAVALAAGGDCWPRAAAAPLDYYHPGTGAYSSTQAYDNSVGSHAWGMLGTVALSQPVPAPAAQYLKDRQQPDGGWEWDAGFGTDSNTTALAVQALLAAGEAASSTAVVDALSYLEAAQNDDAGFPYDPDSAWGTASDANSTALVLQALLAAGQAPAGARWTAYTGGITPTNPISYLLGVQLADGSFAWQAGVPGDRQAATRQVIPALFGRPLPLQAAALEPCRAVYLPEILK